MGKAPKKKRSLAQAGNQGSEQADKRTSRQADQPSSGQTGKSTGWQAGKPASWKAHIFIIAVLGFLAYSNTFHSPFQWDEIGHIVGNPIIKNLGYFTDISRAEGLPVYDGLRSRYIGYFTFALNYKLHGFDVAGYHIVNLAIHLINAILVYFLVLLTFRTPFFRGLGVRGWGLARNEPISGQRASQGTIYDFQLSAIPNPQSPTPGLIALAVALLFVAHPIQTEAVTYVFQRFASLVTMFYLLSLVFYIKARLKSHSAESIAQSAVFSLRGPMPYALCSLLFAVLAMKTKENAFTLPVIIMLYEFLFFTGPLKPRVMRLVPFLLTMLIVPLTIMGTGSTPGEIISQVKDPESQGFITPAPADYFFTQFRVIVTYIRLLFVPVDQNIDYHYPLYNSFFAPAVFLSFLFLSALFGGAVYLLYKTHGAKCKAQNAETSAPYALCALRLVAFGILWFFITLSVESSIIPIPMLINEYRVYLPSVGFFVAVVAGAVLLVNRIAMHRAKRIGQSEKDYGSSVGNSMLYALCAMLILVFVLASTTYARNVLWKDKVSLWEDVVRKSPNSSRGYNNLGIAYYEKRRNDEAIRMYEHAIALNPRHLDAYMNLGVSYAVTGRLDSAIEKFSYVAVRDPKKSAAYLNLGRAYSDLGRPHEAIENFLRAIALNPNYSGAFHGIGTAYARLGRLDEALAAYTRFVELSPRDPEAYGNRGIIYLNKGDVRSALADFQQACSLGNKASCGYMERLR